MAEPATPGQWATRITTILNQTLGRERFPIDVTAIAVELSRHLSPDAPLVDVVGSDLPGFDGGLFRIDGRGWAIVFNDAIASRGRINFTLAHEWGHYLLHRNLGFDELRCSQEDFFGWGDEYRQLEREANSFAASVLMPLDDFRLQIPAGEAADIAKLSACAARYGVSLSAAALRWIAYTEKRAVLVCSRDGFILWAKPSDRALKTGAYLRTANKAVPVPAGSLAAQAPALDDTRATAELPEGVWFNEPVVETMVRSDAYELVLSLLLLPDDAPAFSFRRYSRL